MDTIVATLRERGWASLPLNAALAASYDRLVEHAHWFFDQPDHTKAQLDIRASSGHRGWVPSSEAGDYADEGPRRYEAFDIGRTPEASDLVDHPLRGENRWPAGRRGEQLRIEAESLFAVLAELANDLGRALCADLGVDPSRLQAVRHEPVSQLRLIRYFDAPADAPNAVGMGSHTDYEFFTLLFQSSPGTQVLDDQGQWVDPPHHGCVTVLAGDMLEVFSGGRYRSALHRVRHDLAPRRVSIPFFAGADYSAVVRPAAGSEHSEGVDFGNHLMTQLRRDFPYLREHDGEVVIDLRDTPNRSAFERHALERSTKSSTA